MTHPVTPTDSLRRRLAGALPLLLGVVFAGSLLATRVVRADEMESDAVYLPATGVRSLIVRNPLGTVRVQGWDRPEVRIIANKRAGAPLVLDRLRVRADAGGGRVRIMTGFYMADGTFNPLPLQGAAIDLVIDAPRDVGLAVATFRGDVEASGFRAGAHLSSQQGHIRVADIEGPVDTRAFDGNQWFEAIRGSLAASGVDGDMDLADIRGEQVGATVFRGRVTAREVDAELVELHTTVGDVVFVGMLRPGATYDLATRDGNVRMVLSGSTGFQLTVRAPTMRSGFPLLQEAPRVWHLAPPARPAASQPPPARLDLASLHGAVELLSR